MERHILFLYGFCNKLYQRKYPRYSWKWFINKIVIKVFYKYYAFLLSFFYGAYLPYNATIGKNLKLNHSFYGIFISENAKIGNNCTLVQHITIGSNQPISKDAPIIGDNVFIGANCCIIGKTCIGDNVVIGAGTTIASTNIASGSIVVGQKYRIIKNDKE